MKSKVVPFKKGLICVSVFMLLSYGLDRGFSTHFSTDDQETISKIHSLSASIKADCQNMMLADFHLENDPAYLRDYSRQLAEACMSGK